MPKTTEQLEAEISQLKRDFEAFKDQYRNHQHNDVDGTYHLRKNIVLDQDQGMAVGVGTLISESNTNSVAEGTKYALHFSAGKDTSIGLARNTINAQVSIMHQPYDVTTFVSWLQGIRNPAFTNFNTNKTISVTAAGNTVTTSDYTYTSNELTGALINIYDSSGVFVECQTIASNTSTVITISGTWINTTNNGYYIVYAPMYVGISQFIWKRNYVDEGTGGGVRFGVGPTAAGQNGLLYMDSAGDLYWRPKTGAAVKLN